MKSLNKKLKALFVLLSFAAYMPASFAAIDANTAPELNSSINGGYVGWHEGSSAATGGKYDVNINAKPGGVAQFDWNKFNVGSNVTVDWIFNNPNQTAVNRVLNSGGMSQIYGKLTSSCASGVCGHNKSGNVILINPNGILFGAGSSVNLNSFTASTKDILNMKNIKDIATSGNYLGGKIQAANITGSQGKNYTFTGDDKLTMNYKFGNTIAFDNQTTINNYGNGVIGKVGQITLDGADFNGGFNSKGEPTTNATLVALIGDKIDINNSKIQTFVPNEGTSTNNNWGVARSDVKIITADGVNFVYESIGSIDESATKIKEKALANKADGDKYGININDSRIWTGNAQLNDAIQYSNLVINHSQIFGDKISDNVAGMIAMKGLNDVLITNSQIETVNPNGNVENLDNYWGLRYGDIEIKAGNNIIVENSGIQSVGSQINDYAGNKKVGNIDLIADNGIRISSTTNKGSFNGKEYYNYVSAGGNLNVDAGLTDVVVDVVKGSLVDGLKDVNISGRNVAIKGANVTGDNITVKAGWVDSYKNLPSSDAHGAYGSIVTDNAVIATKGGTNTINILGLNTTLKDTNLIYNDLNFYNATTNANGNNNNVLLKDGTTILDRTASTVNPLTIETNGMLVIDHNQLQQKNYYDALATNQNSDIVLKSVNDLVSIRNNSNVVTSGNITLDAAKSASVSTSDVTAGKNIVMHGKTGVTVGDVIEQQEGDTNVITKRGSNLNANNGTITLTADGAVAGDITGVTIVASNLNSKANTIEAKNGKVAIQANKGDTVKSVINATDGNNTIKAKGQLVIDKADVIASNNNTLTSNDIVGIQNGSTVRAGGKNDITANGTAIVRDASQVIANGDNNITSTTAKVRIEGANTKVESTNADVNITQYETALLDRNYTGTVKAKNNIALNVTGTGKNIEGSGLGQFQYGNRLKLDAENNIKLEKATGDWAISKVDLNSKENKITATAGNVTINNDITLGAKTNKTTIKAGKNVKTNGVINANNKKLIVNAGEKIDIAFTGVSNKSAGLEINSDVNTSGTGAKNQQSNNTNLIGKDVKLTAQDGNLTVAKIKADKLEIANPETTKIAAATDGKAKIGFDNISSDNQGTANVGTAYIEVRELAGWNMDTEINTLPTPGFYVASHDKIDGIANRHTINFEDGNNMLLVYTRTTDCEEPILPTGPSGNINNALTETTVVRLPRHEEGVSAVAPVLNEITDPTANVIMAAARLTLDEENEEDENKF